MVWYLAGVWWNCVMVCSCAGLLEDETFSVCSVKSVLNELCSRKLNSSKQLLHARYIFAVIFVQVVNDYNADDSLPRMPEEQWRASEKHYGSLADCMLSLFMSIANGVSWQEVLEPVRFISAQWVFLFLFFISFTEFAVLNASWIATRPEVLVWFVCMPRPYPALQGSSQ
eukprot:s135_g6.t1